MKKQFLVTLLCLFFFRDSFSRTFCNPSVISRQPTNVTANVGAPALFTVAVSDSTLTFQWQQKTPNGTEFVDAPSALNSTNDSLLLPSVTAGINNRLYRCIIKDSTGCEIITDTVKLTTVCVLAIDSQPANQTVNAGTNATFYIEASEPSATYRWQQDTGTGFYYIYEGNGSFFGTESQSFSIFTVNKEQDQSRYRCRISFNGCIVYSDTVVLNVNCALTIIQPKDTTLDLATSTNTQFSSPALNVFATYRWQEDRGQGFFDIENGNNHYAGVNIPTLLIYDISVIMNKYKYRCIIASNGCTDTSDAATLTTRCPEFITVQPQSQTIHKNGNATFTLSAGATPNAYFVWYGNEGSSSFDGLSENNNYRGVNSNTLRVLMAPLSQNGYKYYCIVYSGACADTSEEVTLTVNNTTGINDVEAYQTGVHLYPNPATGFITIKLDEYKAGMNYQIMDQTGRMIMQGALTDLSTTIDIGKLAAGLYFVQMGEDGRKYKIVKQ